ncbi:MAG: hypothetical protein PHF64_06975 [Methanoregula sp.]|nr:hypothetical protein [Methanoregula sp.]
MQTTSATRAGCGSPALFGSTGTRAAIETDNLAIGCQRIETQNSAVNSATIFPKDSTPSRHTAKQSGHACALHQTGFDRYRRRQAFVMREIPLYMLPAALRRGVAERGGKIYRAVIVRTHWNHYTIKIRCNTKKAVGHRSPLRNRDRTLETFFSTEANDDG